MSETTTTSVDLQTAALSVDGMDCASCVAHVQKAAKKIAGVRACAVNLARGRAVVQFDPAATDAGAIARAVSASGYHSAPEKDQPSASTEMDRVNRQAAHARAWRNRAIAGIALWLPVESIHWIDHVIRRGPMQTMGGSVGWIEWLALASSTIAIVYVGAGFYRSAIAAARQRTTNMDTLIAMGASVAYLYSLIALIGFLDHAWQRLPDLYFMEASGLLALISLGHWLEARARNSAGRAIHELLNLTPATATLLSPLPADSEKDPDFREREVSVSELKIGDVVLIRPGDRVPIDGDVIAGKSSVDESMISGEPLPVTRGVGDQLIGGTINVDGALQLRVKKIGSETALAQIVKLVEHAQSSKPAVQKLADQIAAVFVPTVLLIALITAIGWFAWGTTHQWDRAATWGTIARTVCSVLIIACPCALGLAVPATLMVATGRSAKLGILFRDVDALQAAEKIDTIVLDKTGTITQGKPIVERILPSENFSETHILRRAAAAESFSEHPLARAIVAAARERNIEIAEPSEFRNEPGVGVFATIDGEKLFVGNDSILNLSNVTRDDSPFTRVIVARISADQSPILLGTIELNDQLKPDASEAIARLHEAKFATLLLSGDRTTAANQIAQRVGITQVRAEVKPGGKAQAIRDLQASGKFVAMVGDGINDAPALAQATLGIAIGSGSDIAKETGGVVLLGSNISQLPATFALGRATMQTIRQNLFLAFIYNVVAIPFAAFGFVNPLIAAAAMALSDVTVIGNALRLRYKRLNNVQAAALHGANQT